MSEERERLKGRLYDARLEEKRLTLLIEGYCTTIRSGLNTALTPVENLEVPQLAAQMDELVNMWGELQATRSQIARYQKELH
jgi:hypothetical protein